MLLCAPKGAAADHVLQGEMQNRLLAKAHLDQRAHCMVLTIGSGGQGCRRVGQAEKAAEEEATEEPQGSGVLSRGLQPRCL